MFRLLLLLDISQDAVDAPISHCSPYFLCKYSMSETLFHDRIASIAVWSETRSMEWEVCGPLGVATSIADLRHWFYGH